MSSISRSSHSTTSFPELKEKEETYQLGAKTDYRALFDRLLKYAREVVQDAHDLTEVRQRMRWWAALALLRAAASSPAAAAATLRSKLRAIGAETLEDVDSISRPRSSTRTSMSSPRSRTWWPGPIRPTTSKARPPHPTASACWSWPGRPSGSRGTAIRSCSRRSRS
jgi:hypothetical protein